MTMPRPSDDCPGALRRRECQLSDQPPKRSDDPIQIDARGQQLIAPANIVAGLAPAICRGERPVVMAEPDPGTIPRTAMTAMLRAVGSRSLLRHAEHVPGFKQRDRRMRAAVAHILEASHHAALLDEVEVGV